MSLTRLHPGKSIVRLVNLGDAARPWRVKVRLRIRPDGMVALEISEYRRRKWRGRALAAVLADAFGIARGRQMDLQEAAP